MPIIRGNALNGIPKISNKFSGDDKSDIHMKLVCLKSKEYNKTLYSATKTGNCINIGRHPLKLDSGFIPSFEYNFIISEFCVDLSSLNFSLISSSFGYNNAIFDCIFFMDIILLTVNGRNKILMSMVIMMIAIP